MQAKKYPRIAPGAVVGFMLLLLLLHIGYYTLAIGRQVRIPYGIAFPIGLALLGCALVVLPWVLWLCSCPGSILLRLCSPCRVLCSPGLCGSLSIG